MGAYLFELTHCKKVCMITDNTLMVRMFFGIYSDLGRNFINLMRMETAQCAIQDAGIKKCLKLVESRFRHD